MHPGQTFYHTTLILNVIYNSFIKLSLLLFQAVQTDSSLLRRSDKLTIPQKPCHVNEKDDESGA